MFKLLLKFLVFGVALSLSQLSVASEAGFLGSYQAMKGKYDQISPSLRANAFQEPLSIKSEFSKDKALGEIYALVDHSFTAVSSHLVSANQWCDMLVLHINVKGCYGSADTALNGVKSAVGMGSVAGSGAMTAASGEISLFIGRNFYQPIDEAHAMQYHLAVAPPSDNYLSVTLSSSDGPLGTSDYQLTFEAIPYSKTATFIHFKYSYRYGFLARIALNGYLATIGSGKVGFTVDAYDEDSNPIYVKGLQGIVERNSMRYFIAIRTYLDTYSLAEDDWNSRIEHWYELALPFKRQLLEVEDKNYLKTKTLEYSNKQSLDTALLDSDW